MAQVSTFHEWLVRKYMAHPTKISRVGGGIIDLHHEPTLDTPCLILMLYYVVCNLCCCLDVSIVVTTISVVKQREMIIVSLLQFCSACSIIKNPSAVGKIQIPSTQREKNLDTRYVAGIQFFPTAAQSCSGCLPISHCSIGLQQVSSVKWVSSIQCGRVV